MTLPDTRRFERLTWPEIADAIARGAGVIVPVGSTEQHGPHLPLATDALIATAFADAVADATDMLVAPAIAYGYRSRPRTGGGQDFVGTTSLSGRTFISVVAEIVDELIRQGFRRIALLNAHFENQAFLYEAAVESFERRGPRDARVMVFERGAKEMSPATMDAVFGSGFDGWGVEHAAMYETSLMLHLHPSLVRMERAVDDGAEHRAWYDVLPTPRAMLTASGALSRARAASAEKGRLLMEEIVPGLREAIEREIPPS